MKKSFDKNKLLEALVKRAEGFFYTEEISEYEIEGEKVNKKSKINELSKEDGIENDNTSFIEIEDTEIQENIKNKISQKKFVSKNHNSKNDGLYLGRNEKEISEQSCGVDNENIKNLVLVKKKVTSHYIPPDLSAIKMLVENFGQEINGDGGMLERLTDDELLEMRSEIIKDLRQD